MPFATIKCDTVDDARRAAVDGAVRAAGGRIEWRSSERLAKTYALIEMPAEGLPAEVVRAASGMTVCEPAIIALAVFPAVPAALPALLDALAGKGGPAGVRSCEPCPGGLIVEWEPAVTMAATILAAIDAELGRFRSGRSAELLSPVALEWIARIAAEGLGAPEVEPGRVLERLIARAGLHA